MSFLPALIATAHVFLATTAVCHALLYKRHSQAATGWIASIILYPVLGPIAYALFGVNRIPTKSRRLLEAANEETPVLAGGHAALQEAALRTDLSTQPAGVSAGEWRMLRVGGVVSGAELRPRNAVKLLINGDEAYPAMLEAIENAKDRVWFITYIFETNQTGQRFIDALIAAKNRGVDVRVVLDGVGEIYTLGTARRALRKAGVSVGRFLPPRLVPPQLFINLRNHRKLLCVDSTIGFAGGMNIGGRHMVDAPETSAPNQDTHTRFEGPIVADMERVFIHDWVFIRRKPEVWAPSKAMAEHDPDKAVGQGFCRVISDGPDHRLNQLEALYATVISAAERKVTIVTPYFLPSQAMFGALASAALRGVEVTVVLPRRSNQPYVDRATYRILPALLRRKVRVVRQPDPFAHTKLVAIDERYVVCGSANIDARSLRLNFELGVEIVDSDYGAEVSAYLDDIVARSTPLLITDIQNRPFRKRLVDGLFWLGAPYL